MNTTLFLDVASHQGSLALANETAVLAHTEVDHRIGDAELLPLMERLLQEAGRTYADLTRVACVTGPGGFTSLRVGVTCANVLADQLHIPMAGLHLSDIYKARSHKNEVLNPHEGLRDDLVLSAYDFVWFHSTKKTQVFVRGFGTFADTWPEATLVSIDELLPQLPACTQWIGELMPEHQSIMEKAGLLPAASCSLLAVLPTLLNQQTYQMQTLEPWYGRGW